MLRNQIIALHPPLYNYWWGTTKPLQNASCTLNMDVQVPCSVGMCENGLIVHCAFSIGFTYMDVGKGREQGAEASPYSLASRYSCKGLNAIKNKF